MSARTGSAAEGGPPSDPAEELFSLEKIPTKIPKIKPVFPDSGNTVAAYHCEAAYAIRKVLIEQAKKSFKELEKADVIALLNHSNQHSRRLEERFEEMFIKSQGYGRGQLFSDLNTRIVFKTFLQD